MALPSPRTARRNAIIRPLNVSPSTSTVDEVEANIISCLEPLGTGDENPQLNAIIHQVLMLNEIAIKNDHVGMIRQICSWGLVKSTTVKFHWNLIVRRSLIFFVMCSTRATYTWHLRYVQLLLVIQPLIQWTTQATVGALGSLLEKPCKCSVHPILISGTCKKETGTQHAKMIQMALIAINKTQNHQNFTSYQTVSIASDGKSKRGDALVLLTMK